MSLRKADAIAAAFTALMNGIDRPDLAKMCMYEAASSLDEDNESLIGLVWCLGDAWGEEMDDGA